MTLTNYPAPTTGNGIPVSVQLSGTGVTALTRTSANEYSLTLSLSAAGGNASTCQLTATAFDAAGASQSASFSYRSFNDPETFANFNPPSGSTTYPTQTWNVNVASVSGSGLITAKAVGQAVIEASTTTENSVSPSGVETIAATVVVTVLP